MFDELTVLNQIVWKSLIVILTSPQLQNGLSSKFQQIFFMVPKFMSSKMLAVNTQWMEPAPGY